MLRYTQENLKCAFEGYKYKYAVMAIYIIILFGFIGLNIMVYNKIVIRARDRFSEWDKIEADKNAKLVAAITKKLEAEDNTTPDMG